MLGNSVGDELNDVVVGSEFIIVGFIEDHAPLDDDGRCIVEGFCEDPLVDDSGDDGGLLVVVL